MPFAFLFNGFQEAKEGIVVKWEYGKRGVRRVVEEQDTKWKMGSLEQGGQSKVDLYMKQKTTVQKSWVQIPGICTWGWKRPLSAAANQCRILTKMSKISGQEDSCRHLSCGILSTDTLLENGKFSLS